MSSPIPSECLYPLQHDSGDVRKLRTDYGRRLKKNENLSIWSWLVAVSGSFLIVGIIGLQSGLGPDVVLRSFQPPTAVLDSAADSALMADLVSAETTVEPTAEAELEVVQEIPPPVESMSQIQELPDLVEALSVEDLFTLSSAPRVEEALRPIEPTPSKPEVKRITPSAPTRTTTRRTAAANSSGSGNGTGNGTGGSGTGSGSSGGSFVIPRPSYPSSLRALGVQGTVRLRIIVGASGRASSVTVIGTSGNSTLDQYAAGWVRRNGKAPPGDVRTVIAPLSFVLR